MTGLDVPKQYYRVGGRSILSYCVEAVSRSESIDRYLIVAAQAWRDVISRELDVQAQACRAVGEKFYAFADPGRNRQESILHGLRALGDIARDRDIILIQDAARPLTSQQLLKSCIETAAAADADGAMPVLPMKDTVYYSMDGSRIDALLERDRILAGQAPEAFVYGAYLRANESLPEEELLKINGSSEPAVKAGMRVAMVPGDERNLKITTTADLNAFARMIGADCRI